MVPHVLSLPFQSQRSLGSILRLDTRFEVLAKALQPSVIVMAHIRKRFAAPLRNFLKREALKEEHLNRFSLPSRQRGEDFGRQACCLLKRNPRRRPDCVDLLRLANVHVVSVLTDKQVVSPTDAARISILQEPHFKSASCWIELSRLAVDFQKNCLRDVLRLCRITEDTQRSHMHEAVVAFEDHSESICVAVTEFPHNPVVGKAKEVRIGNAV